MYKGGTGLEEPGQFILARSVQRLYWPRGIRAVLTGQECTEGVLAKRIQGCSYWPGVCRGGTGLEDSGQFRMARWCRAVNTGLEDPWLL